MPPTRCRKHCVEGSDVPREQDEISQTHGVGSQNLGYVERS